MRSPSLGRDSWSDSLRMTLWRRRVPLTLLWVAGVSALAIAVWQYPQRVPRDADLGATMILRQWFHGRTFAAVEKAREDVAAGSLDEAETRLEHYLEAHESTQKGQLHSHAAAEAHDLLAQVYEAQGRSSKAVKTLEDAVERTPLDWYLWYRLAQTQEEAGDLADAADSYREAFKLTLDHPDVASDYLGLLGELGQHEDVLWVEDQFLRARVRAAPIVRAKAGLRRDWVQRTALGAVGIPVEHGSFERTYLVEGLERGDERRLPLPPALFEGLPKDPTLVVLQLRFHNVYHELTLNGLELETSEGVVNAPLPDDHVQFLQRDHSGGDRFVELTFALPKLTLEGATVLYSCPPHRLSDSAKAVIQGARRNLQARGLVR